jgi:ribosomal protein L37AE/L43A
MTPHTQITARTRLKMNGGNICLQCNTLLFAPEWSEAVNENRVKHVWSCDACGYHFETTVYYPTAE